MTDNKNISGIEENDEILQMRRKIAKNRKRRRKKILIIVIASAVAAAVIIFTVINKTYSSYNIVSSTGREDETNAKYITYNNGYIRYSGDGAEYVDSSGNRIWNTTFAMSNPQYKVSKDMVAIADISNNLVLVFNKSGQTGKIETDYNIFQLAVADSGAVAVVLQDSNYSYINLYGIDGSIVYSVKTSLDGDGYPLSVAISPDAKKLMVSYVYSSGNAVDTKVVFYDFSSAGNKDNKYISGEFTDFNNKLIGDVGFLSNDTAVAVSEDSVTYFNSNSSPSESKKYNIEGNIQEVIWGNKKVALLMQSGDEKNPNRIVVYNEGGGKLCDTLFAGNYKNYELSNDTVIMYGSNNFAVMDVGGKFLTGQTTESSIVAIIPNGGRDHYFLINEKFIQRIKLK